MEARINKPVVKPVMHDPMIIPRVKQVSIYRTIGILQTHQF